MPPSAPNYPFRTSTNFKANLNSRKRIRIQGEIKNEYIHYSHKDATGITGQTMLCWTQIYPWSINQTRDCPDNVTCCKGARDGSYTRISAHVYSNLISHTLLGINPGIVQVMWLVEWASWHLRYARTRLHITLLGINPGIVHVTCRRMSDMTLTVRTY